MELIAPGVILAAFVGLLVGEHRAISQPLWYDEQWRAYYVSVSHHWWSQIRLSNAPMSAGWYVVERLAIVTGGNREATLRLANVVWLLPLGLFMYAVARRWLHPVVATVLSLLTMVNGLVVAYALQLKPFVADAAGTMIVVACLLWARETATPWRRVAAFAGASVGLLLATPAVFVAGPLVLCLLYEWWRETRDRIILWGSIATVVVGAVHLRLWVMRQDTLSNGSYWNANFVPHRSFAAAGRFVWDQTRSYVPHFVTAGYQSSQAGKYPIDVSSAWSLALAGVLTGLLALGAWQAALTRPGRYLLFAIVMTFPMTIVASSLRLWPYGFVRVNIYVVPLLYLFCALGGLRLWQLGRPAAAKLRGGPDTRQLVAVGIALGCVVGLAAGAVAAAVSTSVSIGAARAADPGKTYGGYARNLDQAVKRVRRAADASTGVIVVGSMAIHGWQYYMFQRDGMPGVQVPPSRTGLFTSHDVPELTTFATARPELTTLFYFVPQGATGAAIHADEAALAAGGFCAKRQWHLAQTGLLVELDRC